MTEIQSILLLGEGFTWYRETKSVDISIFINENYSITLYVEKQGPAVFAEDTIEIRYLFA